MQPENSYYYFQKAFSPDDCKKIIEQGEFEIEQYKKEGRDTSGTTFGNTHKQEGLNKPLSTETLEEKSKNEGKSVEEVAGSTYIRDSEVSWLYDNWLYDLILPFVHEANRRAGWDFELTNHENFQFTKYYKGGFYNWHSDGGSCNNSKFKKFIPGISPLDPKTGNMYQNYTYNMNWVGKIRKLSCTINLNEPGEYEGGNLEFDFGPHAERERFYECTEIRPQGSIVIFPSFVYHRVTPITKGIRKSLVLWSLGRPFK